MKKFNITVVRHTFSTPIEVLAETEKEARDMALDIAEADSWIFRKNEELFEVESVEEEEYPYIDQYGEAYEPEVSAPAGGGLHKDCDYNAEALYCFYTLKNREAITKYLTKRGFTPGCQDKHYEEWYKGNTLIVFEGYDKTNGNGLWGYVHTELA